jgi:hypothetical protein
MVNLGNADEPVDGLEEDGQSQREEEACVEERAENLRSAVGKGVARWLGGQGEDAWGRD